MSTSTPSLATALASAELLFDRAALESVIVDMGRDIDAALDGERAVFLTVMNGALIFAGLNEEYAKFFPTDPPTRAVARLGVELPNVLVSIKMVAIV